MVTERSRGQHIGPQARVTSRVRRRHPRVLDAVRVHARSVALRPPRIHDRAARVGAGKDRARLPIVRAVPAVRAVRGDAAAPGRRSDPPGAAGCRHPRRPVGRRSAPERRTAAADPRLMRDVYTQHRRRGDRARRISARQACRAASRPKGWTSQSSRPTRPASIAAVFTTNHAQAAPILVAKEHLAQNRGTGSAVVVNSGCANACTGSDGIDHAHAMARHAAEALACDPADVLVASTGVIGVKLEMAKVERGIAEAARSLSSRRRTRSRRAPS